MSPYLTRFLRSSLSSVAIVAVLSFVLNPMSGTFQYWLTGFVGVAVCGLVASAFCSIFSTPNTWWSVLPAQFLTALLMLVLYHLV